MGIFNDYMREGKGIDKKPDNRLRIVVFFDIYFRKFWKLITINMIYILFCIPVVTIGPATAGLAKLMRNYAREEHAFIFTDFIDTFKQNFWRALAVGLLDIVVGALIFFDAYVYLQMASGSSWVRIGALAVLMLSATIYLFMNYYIYTMMVTFRLTFKQLLKNAFIFAWVGFWRNFLITVIVGALTAFVILYFSNIIGFLFLVLIYFTTCGLVISFATYPLIKKHMIDGYDPETGEKLSDETDKAE